MLKEYLAELQKTPLLTREEETALWQLYAGGDREAYNKLMTSSQLMELVQEGMLGLLEAAERYDYKRGVAFSVFAIHRIRGRMLDFLQQDEIRSFSLDDTNAAGIAWADVLAASGRTPFEEAELNMITDRVAQALQRLPAKEQQVLTGIYLEDRSAADMADKGNIRLMAVAWLFCAGIFKKFSIENMAIVPPPLPKKPFTNPDNMPVIIDFMSTDS